MNSEHRVERLGASHDRTTFDSGVLELDHYFHHQCGQDARRKVAAPFVMLNRQDAIVGYYTLSACGLHLAEFPEAIARKLPRYPVLPATLLGRLAIGRSYQGRSLGRFLLMDALYRSWRNTSEVGSVGVAVDALDERASAFYLHYEFMQLRNSPNRLFRPMGTIEKAAQAR